MIQSLRLYFKLISVCIRSQMQHRASFLMMTFAHFLGTFIEVAGIALLFDRFKTIHGWTLPELALIFGVVHSGFSIAECTGRGFDRFNRMVRTGEFDRLLLRPCSTILQVATCEFQLMRIGRLFQGGIVLLWGYTNVGFAFFSFNLVVLIFSIIGTAALFYGLFVIQATISFWLVETLELMNIATYGGVQSGQYPISIYNQGFRMFFTFVIPLGCVVYYPIATLLQKEGLPFWLGVLAPLAGIIFLFLSFNFWNLGVRHYRSTGN